MTTALKEAGFARLFDGNDDPWGFRTRWYELRKRDLTLACLPEKRYHRAYEPGCANGELSAALAPRCDKLLVSDGVPAAVDLARQRLNAFEHVKVFRAWTPDDWPDGQLDLLVLSEMGFYLTAHQLGTLIEKIKQSVAGNGTVLACHWRHEVKGFELSGDAVHEALQTQLGMTRLVHHEEIDFLLDVWTTDARSVAQHEDMV